jgi:2-pyrone-4,6-dicarboxylate lactonase
MTRPCLGPEKVRTPPSFEIPAQACDCHMHVFGPYDAFRLGDDRSYTPPENDANALLGHLDELGLDRGVIVTATAYGTDNSSTISVLKQAPDRLRGVAVLAENVTDSELDEMTDANVRGARVNLFRHQGHSYRGGASLRSLRALAPRLLERGWHAQVWIHVDDIPEVEPELKMLGLEIVIDHMGRIHGNEDRSRPGFQRLCRMLREGQAWAKISGADRNTVQGAPYDDIAPIALDLLAANPDRIVWGSDWPHVAYYEGRTPDAGQLLNLLEKWLPEPRLRQQVLASNPAVLYGFSD